MARIAGIDLPRNKRGEIGLTYIYGLGKSTAQKILAEAGVSFDKKVQDWTDDDLNKIRSIIEQDASITERAIAKVTADFIATKRAHFVTNKTVEDFRQIPMLREAVIAAIKSFHQTVFEALEQPFLNRLTKIQEQIGSVK